MARSKLTDVYDWEICPVMTLYIGIDDLMLRKIINLLNVRCLVDPLRPIQPEDVSKPLKNTFAHTGHGDTFGKSWGNPTTIENVTFRKAKAAGDASNGNTCSPVADRRKS